MPLELLDKSSSSSSVVGASFNNGPSIRIIVHCSDPIEEDYEESGGGRVGENQNRGDPEQQQQHSDNETGGGFMSDSGGADDSGGRQLAPLSNRHSQSNSEVMQNRDSVFPQSNRRGSTTGAGNNNGIVNGNNHHNHLSPVVGNELVLSRRPSAVLTEILSTRRPSALMAALTRPHQQYRPNQRQMMEIREGQVLGSTRTINMGGGGSSFGGHHSNGPDCPEARDFKRRNRRIGE